MKSFRQLLQFWKLLKIKFPDLKPFSSTETLRSNQDLRFLQILSDFSSVTRRWRCLVNKLLQFVQTSL